MLLVRLRAETSAQRAEVMAKLPNTALGLLLIVLQGIRGDVAVFSSVGVVASLPCANMLSSDCSSTTWIYSRDGNASIEVVTHGITDRPKRLGLLIDCSLRIANVTTEDAGLYVCQQYLNGTRHGKDAFVYHSVLHISSSWTAIEEGSNETLYCHLNGYRSCANGVYGDFHLSLVDERGAELQNTTNQLISRESPCSIRLTVGLRDLNATHTQRQWKCQLTAGDNYTISVPAVKLARTPAVTREPAPPLQPSTPPPETAGVALCVLSVEIPIQLFIFSLLLIMPGLIGIVHVVRRKQTCRGEAETIELQVLS